MSYNGFFIRDYVGESISGSNSSNWTNSPDIICTGPVPLPDPRVVSDVNHYKQGLPQANSQTPLTNNWVYLRGLNPQSGPLKTTLYLYYVDTSIVLWPQNWKTAGIVVAGNQQNWQTFDAPADTDSDGIAGTITPFGWTPPRQGIHYCLVAWAENGADQLTPPDLASIGSVSDMAKFIVSHPNVGWKNTVEVDASQPTLQGVASVIGAPDGGQMIVGLQCVNIPTDGYIQFSVPGPDQDNTIYFPKTQVAKPNYGQTFLVNYPPGYETSLSWTYYKGPTEVPDGANIIPFVGEWGSSNEFIEHAREVAPGHLIEAHHHGTPQEFLANGDAFAVSSKATRTIMLIGSVPFRLTHK